MTRDHLIAAMREREARYREDQGPAPAELVELLMRDGKFVGRADERVCVVNCGLPGDQCACYRHAMHVLGWPGETVSAPWGAMKPVRDARADDAIPARPEPPDEATRSEMRRALHRLSTNLRQSVAARAAGAGRHRGSDGGAAVRRVHNAAIGAAIGLFGLVAFMALAVLVISFMSWEWQGEIFSHNPPMMFRWAAMNMVVGAVLGWLKTGGEG